MTVTDIRWARIRKLLDLLRDLEYEVKRLAAEGNRASAGKKLKRMKKVRSYIQVMVSGLKGQVVPRWIPELREEPEASSQSHTKEA